MHGPQFTVLALAGSALAFAACDADRATAVHERPSHDHGAAFQTTSPEMTRKIAELRQWSASFHDLDRAAEAGYFASIGCIDETVGGTDPSVARGMGYHVTRGDVDVVTDGVIDIDEPEFLVFAPHPRDAELPREERLANARLVGFDYFVFAADWPHPDPPELFGAPMNWSEPFQGWMRHLYLWANNPEGIFEDFNGAVRLCTELLTP